MDYPIHDAYQDSTRIQFPLAMHTKVPAAGDQFLLAMPALVRGHIQHSHHNSTWKTYQHEA